MKRSPAFYIVNTITCSRIVMAPILVVLVLYNATDIFKWVLAAAFATDMIDGFLARRLKVVSKIGAKLDSVADDALLIASAVAVWMLKPEFVRENSFLILAMVIMLVIQNGMALWRYGRMSSYHTYSAKFAMLLQGSFLILLFFLPEVPYWLFYPAVAVTILDLTEEIILVMLLPKWEANVKGLYWVLRRKRPHRA